ncbi:MAG: hypothetical protein J6W55_03965 [Acidaminococcaceae bacterium]|nr:hypothetical protein [Acidaminococcaceae bacterium]
MHQFVLAVVMRFVAAAAGTVFMVMPVVVSMVMPVVMSMVVFMIMSVVVLMVMSVVMSMIVSVVMSVVVSMVMSVVVPIIVFMVVVMIVSHPLSMGMCRNMVMFMIVIVAMLVGVLLHNPVQRVFFNCTDVLHFPAAFRKRAYSGVFRTAADVFQVFHFICHCHSPFLAPELRAQGPVPHSAPALISLSG